MGRIKMHEWEVWQSYRKDRGTPPWIKVHREILTSKKWVVLSDAEKGQLVSMWIVAATDEGYLPDDANLIRKMCGLDEVPNLQKFKDLRWVVADGCQLDVKLTSNGCQGDTPEAEEKQNREEGEKEENGQAPRYAFTGVVVNLTRNDLRKWEEKFPTINVIEHLKGIDKTYAARIGTEEESKNKNWFFSAFSALAKADNEKRLQRPQGEAWV